MTTLGIVVKVIEIVSTVAVAIGIVFLSIVLIEQQYWKYRAKILSAELEALKVSKPKRGRPKKAGVPKGPAVEQANEGTGNGAD